MRLECTKANLWGMGGGGQSQPRVQSDGDPARDPESPALLCFTSDQNKHLQTEDVSGLFLGFQLQS